MKEEGKDMLIIFDLDGTLFKTESSVIPAVKASLRDLGLEEVDEERILSLIGEKTTIFCKKLLGDENEDMLEEMIDKLWVYEEKYVSERGELYDGVEEMLKRLDEKGYELAISSNGRKEYVNYVLECTSIRRYFEYIEGMASGKSKGDIIGVIIEESGKSSAVMVGDKRHDFLAASQNGIPSIGVEWGYGGEELEEASFTVGSQTELQEIIDDIADDGAT